jgi:hypothetical protein
VRFLARKHVTFALIGGQAASLRGEERVTADIDMIIGADINQALDLTSALVDTRLRPLFSGVSEVIQRSFMLPLIDETTQIRVDLALALTGFEHLAISRAEVVQVAGCPIPVATAEDLIIMKALAGRPRDDEDVRGIILTQGGRLDWSYCEDTAAQLGEAIDIDLLSRIRELRSSAES